jgi:hypothetical protein
MDAHSYVEPPGYNFIEDCRVENLGLEYYCILVPFNYNIGLNKEDNYIYFPSDLTLLIKY